MASCSDRSSPRGFPIRESRSLHDLFSGFFFNHVDHSRTISTTGDQKSSPFWGGVGDDGVSSDSSAVALVFGRNSSSDVDESRLIDSMAEITCAVKSSRMRRSDTWDDSLLLLRKSDDPLQPEDVSPPPLPLPPSSGLSPSLPSVRSTSGVISFVASGGAGDTGSGLRGLLADIFNPNGTGSRSTSAGSDPAAAAADAVSARHSVSTALTLESSGGGNTCPPPPAAAAAADDFSLLPTSPKHLSKVRRQLTLPAVLEGGDPGSVETEEKRIITKVDVTHSNVAPEKTPPLQGTNAPPNSPYGVPAKASEADLLALPEAMKTPAAKPRPPPPSPRKFGILELFAVGERRSVRNRDINAMAPQSW